MATRIFGCPDPACKTDHRIYPEDEINPPTSPPSKSSPSIATPEGGASTPVTSTAREEEQAAYIGTLLLVSQVTVAVFAALAAPTTFAASFAVGFFAEKTIAYIPSLSGGDFGGCSAGFLQTITKTQLPAVFSIVLGTVSTVEHLIHHSKHPLLHRISHMNLGVLVAGFTLGFAFARNFELSTFYQRQISREETTVEGRPEAPRSASFDEENELNGID